MWFLSLTRPMQQWFNYVSPWQAMCHKSSCGDSSQIEQFLASCMASLVISIATSWPCGFKDTLAVQHSCIAGDHHTWGKEETIYYFAQMKNLGTDDIVLQIGIDGYNVCAKFGLEDSKQCTQIFLTPILPSLYISNVGRVAIYQLLSTFTRTPHKK